MNKNIADKLDKIWYQMNTKYITEEAARQEILVLLNESDAISRLYHKTLIKLLIKDMSNKNLSMPEIYRRMGAIETILILNGIIDPGATFNYKSIKKKFFFMIFNIPQSYTDYILDLAENFLKEK